MGYGTQYMKFLEDTYIEPIFIHSFTRSYEFLFKIGWYCYTDEYPAEISSLFCNKYISNIPVYNEENDNYTKTLTIQYCFLNSHLCDIKEDNLIKSLDNEYFVIKNFDIELDAKTSKEIVKFLNNCPDIVYSKVPKLCISNENLELLFRDESILFFSRYEMKIIIVS